MTHPFKPLVISHGWIDVAADSIVDCLAFHCRRCRTVKFLPGRRARAPGFLMKLLRFTGRHTACKRRGGPTRDEGDRP